MPIATASAVPGTVSAPSLVSRSPADWEKETLYLILELEKLRLKERWLFSAGHPARLEMRHEISVSSALWPRLVPAGQP